MVGAVQVNDWADFVVRPVCVLAPVHALTAWALLSSGVTAPALVDEKPAGCPLPRKAAMTKPLNTKVGLAVMVTVYDWPAV